MKGNKILAVIALIALTGFLWMACDGGGGSSSGGDGGKTTSGFGNAKVPVPETITEPDETPAEKATRIALLLDEDGENAVVNPLDHDTIQIKGDIKLSQDIDMDGVVLVFDTGPIVIDANKKTLTASGGVRIREGEDVTIDGAGELVLGALSNVGEEGSVKSTGKLTISPYSTLIISDETTVFGDLIVEEKGEIIIESGGELRPYAKVWNTAYDGSYDGLVKVEGTLTIKDGGIFSFLTGFGPETDGKVVVEEGATFFLMGIDAGVHSWYAFMGKVEKDCELFITEGNVTITNPFLRTLNGKAKLRSSLPNFGGAGNDFVVAAGSTLTIGNAGLTSATGKTALTITAIELINKGIINVNPWSTIATTASSSSKITNVDNGIINLAANSSITLGAGSIVTAGASPAKITLAASTSKVDNTGSTGTVNNDTRILDKAGDAALGSPVYIGID